MAESKFKKVAKKAKKLMRQAVVHVKATFNNTIITGTDTKGGRLVQHSAGSAGFKGSRKSTPYAAQVAAESVAKFLKTLGVEEVNFIIKGPGSGRESALRAFAAEGIKITQIEDWTPIPHNGCRPEKERRV